MHSQTASISLNSTPSPPPPIPSSDLVSGTSVENGASCPPTSSAIPLSLPTDTEWFAPPICLLREQIELFAATPKDVAERKTGAKPVVGAVGLRCKHCSHLPRKSRGAVAYPTSIALIHQAVRNFQRHHFFSCEQMPEDVKLRMKSFKPKERQSRHNSSSYWVRSSRDELGLIDVIVNHSEEDDKRKNEKVGGGSTASGGAKKKKGEGHHPHIRFRDGFVGASGIASTAASAVPSSSAQPLAASSVPAVPAAEVAAAADQGEQSLANLLPASSKRPLDLDTSTNRKRAMSDASETSLSALDWIDDLDVDVNLDAFLGDSDDLLKEITMGVTAKNAEEEPAAFHASLASKGSSPTLHAGPEDPMIGKSSATHLLNILETSTDSIADGDGAVVEVAEDQTDHDKLVTSRRERTEETESSETNNPFQISAMAMDLSSFEKQDSSSPLLTQMNDNQLLTTLKTVLSMVQRTKQTNPDLKLLDIGKTIYRAFVGSEPHSPPDIILKAHTQGGESPALEEAFAEAQLGNDQDNNEKRTKRRRSLGSNLACVDDGLQRADLPVQLCIFITNLLAANDEDRTERYRSMDEVEQDLVAMLADTDRHLFDIPPSRQTGRLKFPLDRLYGREVQQKLLAASFDRVIKTPGPREAVFIEGVSGTGKTTLVERQLRHSLYPLGGRLITGKFDALKQRQPVAVVCRALDEYCEALAMSTDDLSHSIRASVASVQGIDVLFGLMPNLNKIAPRQSPLEINDIAGGVDQLFYNLNLFIRAIASPATPVVFFFDDLQWADEAALEMIARIISEPSLRSLLFIGCYRNDEVNESHPIMHHRQRLSQAGIFTSDIALGDLGRNECNAMISDLLHLPPRTTRPLSDAICAKTSGSNPLLVKQFLLSLNDDKLLSYSASVRRWHWDIEAIQAKNVTDDVAILLSFKMVCLDPRTQALLQRIACLGSQCKAATLAKIDITDSDGVVIGLMENNRALQILVNEGILSMVGNSFQFSHDKVQEAAYELVLDRPAMHLEIGRQLHRKAVSTDEVDDIIFITVDQYMRGIELVIDHAEQIAIAGLCLEAGKRAMAKSEFVPASLYHLQGSALLHNTDWEQNYDLALDLFTCCAEAQYVTGNYEGVTISYNPITVNARSIQDKLPAFMKVLLMLSSQGRHQDAIEAGCAMLGQLGESFKKDTSKADMIIEYLKTKAMMQAVAMKHMVWSIASGGGWDGSVANALAQAPPMQNKEKEMSMKLLNRLSRPAYQINQNLLGVMMLRAIQISLSHGVCQESAVTFANFAVHLAFRDQIDEAYRFSKLSLNLVERFGIVYDLPQVFVSAWTIVNPYIDPLQSILVEVRRGHDIAMRSGNIDWGMVLGRRMSSLLLTCATDLKSAAEVVHEILYEMKAHKHSLQAVTSSVLQLMLILIDDGSDDPTILSGDIMNYKAVLQEVASRRDSFIAVFEINMIRVRLMYMFGAYQEAGALLKDMNQMEEKRNIKNIIFDETLYTGLVAAVLARMNLNEFDEWKKIAEDSLHTLQNLSHHSKWNFAHKAALLDAEISYYIQDDRVKATEFFMIAIELASKHKFVGDHALILERAAIFCSATGEEDLAQIYFRQAETMFRQWGALRNADAIQNFKEV